MNMLNMFLLLTHGAMANNTLKLYEKLDKLAIEDET